MEPKGHHHENQGENPPAAGFYVPQQPPPAYEAGQPNYTYPQQQQQHLVQRKIVFLLQFLCESFNENCL